MNSHSGVRHSLDGSVAPSLAFDRFRLLLTTIYLFTLLWEWFLTLQPPERGSGDEVHLLLGDLAPAEVKDRVLSFLFRLKGKQLPSPPDETWREVVKKLDREGDGVISFESLCLYVVTQCRKPESYIRGRRHSVHALPDGEERKEGDISGCEWDEEDHPLFFESVSTAVREAEEKVYREKLEARVAELRALYHVDMSTIKGAAVPLPAKGD